MDPEDEKEPKDEIESDVIPLYQAYKNGDESVINRLNELKWYYEAIITMNDESWAHMYNLAVGVEPQYAEEITEQEKTPMSQIWENLKAIEPEEDLLPLEEEINSDLNEEEPRIEKVEAPVRRPVEYMLVRDKRNPKSNVSAFCSSRLN